MTKSRKSFKLVALMLAVLFTASFVAAGRQTNLTASADDALWTSSYESKQAAKEAGAELNLQIAEEGMVLLKNDGALPIDVGTESKVTLFGLASYSPAGGGSSGGDTSGGVVTLQADIVSGIKAGGFVINPTVAGVYADWMSEKYTVEQNYYGQTITTEVSKYASDKSLMDDETNGFDSKKSTMEASYSEYSTAIVTFADGSSSERVHSLQLDAEQYELLDYVTSKFSKVIVLINSSNPLEIGKIADNEKVDAILLVGEPGDNGFLALGKILNGSVNPSGRTTDTWAADFTKDPTYCNYNTTGAGNGYSQYIVNGKTTNTYFVDYEEGIYVGYRYYETRAYEETKKNSESNWWKDNVTYTFGYGLSYTSFNWTVKPVTESGVVTKSDVLEFDVTVKNVGDVAGKDVVQLYYTAPYGEAETGNKTVIEKSHVVLGDFAKTSILEPGKSETVRLSIDVKDMASYDYKVDRTYVLDAGNYEIKFMRNAHDVVSSVNYTVAKKQLCNVAVTGAEITNRFDDVSAVADNWQTAFVRSDFEATFPTAVTDEEKILDEDTYSAWVYDGVDDPSDPWYTETMPVYADAETRPAEASVLLSDLIGKDYNDPLWEELLNQLTLQEMADLINNGGFQSIAIDYIGKPFSFDTDGPKGWIGSGIGGDKFNSFAAEPVIAATFNKDLAYKMGVMIGEQGLWGNDDQDGVSKKNYTGWYAPGMNIHRSPFDSRYTEYYSEDSVLTGMMAANASLGAKSKGCYVCLKHFAFHNDGGGIMTYRGMMMAKTGEAGLSAWMNEQTAREVYLKGYQIAVEDGEATFAMSSFTRIGKTWCGGSYALNTQILRGEWGFKGAVVTDISIYGYLNAYQMIRAGGNLMLGNYAGTFIEVTDDMSATQVTAMRNATKQVLYMVANSNAMQPPKSAAIVYTYPQVENEDGDLVDMVIPEVVDGNFRLDVATAKTNTNNLPKITYTAEGLPEGMTIENGVICGKPKAAGTYTVTVTASADDYTSASVVYTLVVNESATKVEDSSSSGSTDSGASGGCASSVSGIAGAVAVALLVGVAFTKKKED